MTIYGESDEEEDEEDIFALGDDDFYDLEYYMSLK